MPKISVIVPVYYVEDKIHRCVDSILAQSFYDFELILVDDGSPDNCPSICDDYAKKDCRVTVIHQNNKGVSAARNTGIEYARGRYIAFADSDDYLDKNWLQQLHFAALSHNAELVQSGIIWVDDNGKEIKKTVRDRGMWEIKSQNDYIEYLIYNVLYHGSGWEVWTALFDLKIIKKHSIRFCTTCYNFAEDLGFILEYLFYCKKIISIQDCCYYYVQHAGSMMAVSKDIVKLDAVNEVAVQFGKRFFEEIKGKQNRKKYSILYYLIMNNQYIKIDLYSDERKRICRVNKEITNIKWHDKWMRHLIYCTKDMKEIMGKKKAKEAIINARYFANRNLLLFRIEKKIFNY